MYDGGMHIYNNRGWEGGGERAARRKVHFSK